MGGYSRLISAATYKGYAKKYGITQTTKDGKPKTLSSLAKSICSYETKHLKKGEKGLYYY